jgi:broad specificity phosphatase PhoE
MIENPTNLYIVRHGKTDWNVEHKIQGQTDIPLNAEGELQAKALGVKFKDVQIDHAFSSDLLRAKRTAEIAMLEKNLAVKTTEALREGGMGIFEGTLTDDLYPLFNKWLKLSEEERLKHERYNDLATIESSESIVSRFITFLREASVTFRGQNLLIVTHAAVMSNFLRHVGFTDHEFLHVSNTAMIHAQSDGVEFEIIKTEGIEPVEYA